MHIYLEIKQNYCRMHLDIQWKHTPCKILGFILHYLLCGQTHEDTLMGEVLPCILGLKIHLISTVSFSNDLGTFLILYSIRHMVYRMSWERLEESPSLCLLFNLLLHLTVSCSLALTIDKNSSAAYTVFSLVKGCLLWDGDCIEIQL